MVVEIAVDTVVEPVALALDEGLLDLQVEHVHVGQSQSPRDPLELAKIYRNRRVSAGFGTEREDSSTHSFSLSPL